MNYESPIKIFRSLSNATKEMDGEVFHEVRQYVDVDKEELLKALAYDRQQYEKGYSDAKSKYEKALDKACDYFYRCAYCPPGTIISCKTSNVSLERCKKCWEEWCFKDE